MTYSTDAIASITMSSITLPLSTPISNVKDCSGRQRPMTEIMLLFAEISTKLDRPGFAAHH